MIFSIEAKLDEGGINIELLDSGFTDAFHKAVANIAVSAKDFWVAQAQMKLKTSRDVYVDGLMRNDSYSISKTGSGAVHEIKLVGKMANNHEFGMDSFDMKTAKPGWLGGSKAKIGKDGKKYIVIPFRHSSGDSHRFAVSSSV